MNLKTTSRTVLLLIALASIPAIAAHPDAGPDQRPPRGEQQNLNAITEQLRLSSEEEQAFRALLEKHHAERQAMHKENRDDGRDLHERHRSEMAELLNEEQLQTFESLRPERRPRKQRPPN